MAVDVTPTSTTSREARPSRSRRLALHPDRLFDPDPGVRRAARAIYEETATLPLVCPHGHVDPALFALDAPFPEPASLIVTPDHYIYRMLYSQGVPLEALGIPARDGTPVEQNPRKIWQRFGEYYYLFRGTPTGIWLDHELAEVFGVRVRLTGATAQRIYDEIVEKLGSPEFRPRALFERFRIEVLATTDAATDQLTHHRAVRASDWTYGTNGPRGCRVIPTFRPDTLFRVATPAWASALAALERAHGAPITCYDAFITALAARRRYFRLHGATATDHAVVEPYTQPLGSVDAEALFQRARAGTSTTADQRAFEAHLLLEMARLSTEDGMVMQLHPGSFRDHNPLVAGRYGADRGADIPLATEYTRNLKPLLDAYGNDQRLTLVLFTLDEATYARELAPLAGHYPAVRLGPPWWFHDSPEGMRRYREQVTGTAGVYNTAGFNDDTRAFCSIPARHDLARRADANWLATLVARHQIDLVDARDLARALAYELARRAYKLDQPADEMVH